MLNVYVRFTSFCGFTLEGTRTHRLFVWMVVAGICKHCTSGNHRIGFKGSFEKKCHYDVNACGPTIIEGSV